MENEPDQTRANLTKPEQKIITTAAEGRAVLGGTGYQPVFGGNLPPKIRIAHEINDRERSASIKPLEKQVRPSGQEKIGVFSQTLSGTMQLNRR